MGGSGAQPPPQSGCTGNDVTHSSGPFGHSYIALLVSAHKTILTHTCSHTYTHTVAYTNPNTHGQWALRHNMCSVRRAVTQTSGPAFRFCGSLCREKGLGKKSKPGGGALHPHMFESQRKQLVSSTAQSWSSQQIQQGACGSLLSSAQKQIWLPH